MDKYIISSAFAMGEPHDTYGQTWYAKVEEMQYPVMFNLMSGTVQEGDRITFEEQTVQTFKSGKSAGKEYRRLKKVKVEEGAPRVVTADTIERHMAEDQKNNDLEARVKALEDKVFGVKLPSGDRVITEISDDPIDLSEIPF